MNSLPLEIVNPLQYPNWDELLLTQETYSFFYSSSWAKVLCESYHYQPLYFAVIDRGKLSVLLPVMEVKSVLTGTRGVSLPFTDSCTILLCDPAFWQPVLTYLKEYGNKAGWRYLELRSETTVPQDVPRSSFYYRHTLDLTQGTDRLYAALRDSTKRNIRNAEREGITIKAGTSGEFMEEFCRLNYLTRKDHGLPPQPLIFFNKVHEHILARNLGHIILAFNKGVAIAGAVFFHSRDTVIYKYGASDRNYRHLRPNNLIMWEAIQSCARMGHKEFSFGRTEPENEGLRQFKNGWGTDEKILNYVTYDIKRNRFVDRSLSVAQNSRCFGLQRKIFRHMPIALAKIVGKVLYRHVG